MPSCICIALRFLIRTHLRCRSLHSISPCIAALKYSMWTVWTMGKYLFIQYQGNFSMCHSSLFTYLWSLYTTNHFCIPLYRFPIALFDIYIYTLSDIGPTNSYFIYHIRLILLLRVSDVSDMRTLNLWWNTSFLDSYPGSSLYTIIPDIAFYHASKTGVSSSKSTNDGNEYIWRGRIPDRRNWPGTSSMIIDRHIIYRIYTSYRLA